VNKLASASAGLALVLSSLSPGAGAAPLGPSPAGKGPVEAGRAPAGRSGGSTAGGFAAVAGGRSLSPRTQDWVPGQVLVQRREGVPASEVARLHSRLDGRVVDSIPAFRVEVVSLAQGETVAAAARRYSRDPRVTMAEPNFRRRPLDIPNDPGFAGLWGLRNVGAPHPVADPPPLRARGKEDADIDANGAWDRQEGLPITVVAVLDTGADLDHPDLDENLWNNPGEIPGDGLDNDANGYVDDVHGWDFQQGDGVPQDDIGHGSHVAGTVAAEADNGLGVAGVCRRCALMILKSALTIRQELDALAYARAEGAHILNGSFGGPSWSGIERDAFAVTGRAGVLSVIAAGNDDLDNDLYLDADANHDGRLDSFSPSYPASYTVPSILAVGASNHKDQYGYLTGCATERAKHRCAFTSWGHDSVDLAAPGVDIRSTVPDDSFATFAGTSMAAPHVAGVAGLVKSEHPTYSVKELKNAVLNSVDEPKSLRRLRTFRTGPVDGHFTRTDGRVNAKRALDGSTRAAHGRSDGNMDGAKKIDRRRRSGSLRWPRDSNDVFKRVLKEGARYSAVLDGPRDENLDLVVYKPGTLEIWQFELGCYSIPPTDCKLLRYGSARGGREAVIFTARSSRAHFFQVSAGLKSRGRYTLRVRRI
jgi:subtilisin family serine protease